MTVACCSRYLIVTVVDINWNMTSYRKEPSVYMCVCWMYKKSFQCVYEINNEFIVDWKISFVFLQFEKKLANIQGKWVYKFIEII